MDKVIGKLSESADFKEGKLLPSEKKINWIPVLARGEFYMGISEEGEWVVEVKEGLHCLSIQRVFVYAMVLLEQPIDSVREKLLSFFKEADVATNIDEIFPFVEIVRAGLDQGADYWAELAFRWYHEIPVEKKRALKDSICKVSDAKWASQKIRQKAEKELRGLEVSLK